MALYDAILQEEYILDLAQSLKKGKRPPLMNGLGAENPFKLREGKVRVKVVSRVFQRLDRSVALE